MATTNLYVGLNDKDTKVQELSNLEAKAKISATLFGYCPNGFTLQECQGMYKHNDGTIVCENTIKVIMFDFQRGMLFEIIEDLKRKLNQECIAVEVINSTVDFV